MGNQTGSGNASATGSAGAAVGRRVAVVFLNCKNLFDVKACGRAPKSDAALADKTRRLATLLQSLLFDEPPAFLALSEVGTPNLGVGVATAAFPTANYQSLWSHDGKLHKDETGLLLLHDANIGTANSVAQRDRPLRNDGQRSRWLAGKFTLPGAAPELGIVVNHWSSGIYSESDAAYQRRRSADELADLFRGAARLGGPGPVMFNRDDAVILVGDFNCDPFDPVFRLTDKGSWTASHSRAAVEAATGPSLPCFYNPLLKAPDIDGTIGAGLKSRMVDYLLFSRNFLLGGSAFRYVAGSIRTSSYDPLASDHLAVGATFDTP